MASMIRSISLEFMKLEKRYEEILRKVDRRDELDAEERMFLVSLHQFLQKEGFLRK